MTCFYIYQYYLAALSLWFCFVSNCHLKPSIIDPGSIFNRCYKPRLSRLPHFAISISSSTSSVVLLPLALTLSYLVAFVLLHHTPYIFVSPLIVFSHLFNFICSILYVYCPSIRCKSYSWFYNSFIDSLFSLRIYVFRL